MPLLIIIVTFCAGILSYPFLIKILLKLNITDIPGGRKIHQKNVPYLGGIGFVVIAFLSLFIWMPKDYLLEMRYLLYGVSFFFFLGLFDDLNNLSSKLKLVVQLMITTVFVFIEDVRITGIYGLFGVYEIPFYISLTITVLFITTLVNSVNFIDGIDGLAGSFGLTVFAFFGWWFYDLGYDAYAYFSFAFVGSLSSFLIFNWYPAKIFMGDTGSLVIGFSLSVLAVFFIDINGTMSGLSSAKFAAPFSMAIALFVVPIYDTFRVLVKRILKGQSPMYPDKSHIHHFLLRLGLKHDHVTFILIGVQIFVISFMVLAKGFGDEYMLPLIIFFLVLLGLYFDRIILKRMRKNRVKNVPVDKVFVDLEIIKKDLKTDHE